MSWNFTILGRRIAGRTTNPFLGVLVLFLMCLFPLLLLCAACNVPGIKVTF